MCGITGFWTQKRGRKAELESRVSRMTDTLVHRGPDGRGTWTNANQGLAFGHRRLAIIDLSPEGHQPMTSRGKRYSMVFNGEVYNFEELRAELGGEWRGHSDSEVILEAIERYGLEPAVKKFVGMFAIALWDKVDQRLYLIRDRLGIKPLYWGRVDGTWVFGSELKSIRAMNPERELELDRDALAAYMRYNCVPAPRCIYKELEQVEPGVIVQIDKNGARKHTYWDPRDVARGGLADPFNGSPSDAVDALEEVLVQAVGDRMVADVPLGAFLSGGVDSSTVVALMAELGSKKVQTFSIGFEDAGYNEAEQAAEVARHLGTEHTELYVQPADALAVVESLPTMFDEPFADSSQIPTFLVSQLARKHVTVSLSGDGGDELFAGYNRHTFAPKVWNAAHRVPRGVKSAVSAAVMKVPVKRWEQAFETFEATTGKKLPVRLPADKLQKLADILPSASPEDMYRRLTSHWKPPTDVVIGAHDSELKSPGLGSFAEDMMLMDLLNYLPNDILTKVDRASMATSLEARVPLLDHRVAELAWRLPMDVKLRDGQSKWALRQVLYKRVPRELIERPKMGFGIPIDAWLRGPLRDWAEDLLQPAKLEGVFRPELIQKRWREHLEGTRNWQHHLWDVLMFQAWNHQA